MQENQSAEENISFDFDDEQDSSVEIKNDDSFEASGNNDSEESRTIDRNSSDELENYSENVQKRINQLTAKRKQAMEEAESAYQYAEAMKQQNEEMKKRLEQLDQGYISEYSGRVETQAQNAQRLYAEAMEAGDYAKAAEAQNMMANLAIEKERVRLQKARQEQQAQNPAPQNQNNQNVQPRETKDPREDPRLKAWIKENPWFLTNRVMKAAAEAIHHEVVTEDGINPATQPDEYYAEIDRRLRLEFPQKFQEQRKSAQSVAPASNGRSATKSGRKKTVELTPGQVTFAKKMGIPLEVYAKEVAKIEQRNAQ